MLSKDIRNTEISFFAIFYNNAKKELRMETFINDVRQLGRRGGAIFLDTGIKVFIKQPFLRGLGGGGQFCETTFMTSDFIWEPGVINMDLKLRQIGVTTLYFRITIPSRAIR